MVEAVLALNICAVGVRFVSCDVKLVNRVRAASIEFMWMMRFIREHSGSCHHLLVCPLLASKLWRVLA